MTNKQAAFELAEARKVYLVACERFEKETGSAVYARNDIQISDMRKIEGLDVVKREISTDEYPVRLSMNVKGIEFCSIHRSDE